MEDVSLQSVYLYVHGFTYLKTDIVPDPPDGPPVIEAITGKTINLSWKRPKRLDPSFGRLIGVFICQFHSLAWILHSLFYLQC